MILYTTTPYELLFPEEDTVYQSQQVIDCDAGQLVVERIDDGSFRVIRLLSSDPNAFLKPEYAPGSLLSARWIP